MLTVCSGTLLEALTYSLAMTTAPTAPQATAALQVCTVLPGATSAFQLGGSASAEEMRGWHLTSNQPG